MLHANEVMIRRAGKRIVDTVSMSVIGGELVALLGPSGAGKSTLLRALCGDIAASAGEVWLGGKPVGQWSPRERALRRAVLLQTSPLSFPMTALDVVLMGRLPHVRTAEGPRDVAIADAALAWVEA